MSASGSVVDLEGMRGGGLLFRVSPKLWDPDLVIFSQNLTQNVPENDSKCPPEVRECSQVAPRWIWSDGVLLRASPAVLEQFWSPGIKIW